MIEQIRVVSEAYHLEVSLKNEALKKYDVLSDQLQDKIIKLVETKTMYKQLQVAFQVEIAESESWKRQNQSLEQQLEEQLQVNQRQAKEVEVAKIK